MVIIFDNPGFDSAFNSIFIMFFITWVISIFMKNVSIVDIIWGLGYVLQVYKFYSTYDFSLYSLLLLLLVGFHGIRLSIFLGIRNIGKEEDQRYQMFRRKYGGDKHYWWISLFQVFVLQALINLLVCSCFGFFIQSVNTINSQTNEINQPNLAFILLGVILMQSGSWIEAISDNQLQNFKSKTENEGKLLTEGLWKYSRHPNYFGEVLFWWGGYCFNCSIKQYWTFYAPLIMSLVIVFLSGVALLENSKRRKSKYYDQNKEYYQKTAKFIPFIW